MTNTNIYKDIAMRTGGDIYIGVVGPVRSGKSTLIKKFMDTVVIPNMEDEPERARAVDELPQSAAGRTIMTTEPKFVPEKSAKVKIDDTASFNVRMIDCVGYIIPSAIGYIEEGTARMVKTPWFEDAIPFNMAAEIGTKKVITEHSTIGLVVTSDGSITDIPRDEYEEAEERVISELIEINKPFIVLLNSLDPHSNYTQSVAQEMRNKYGVSVLPVSCADLTEDEIKNILGNLLYEFPIKEIGISMPKWITALEKTHKIRQSVFDSLKEASKNVSKIKDINFACENISQNENLVFAKCERIDLGQGRAQIVLGLKSELFYNIIGEKTGIPVKDEAALLSLLTRFSKMEKEYSKIKDAYNDVNENGYGIVMPGIEELTFHEPQIIHQNGKYGVRLKAGAPAIHLMKTHIETEITPIVGSEEQSEELIMYLMKEFDEDPIKIWQSNIFGKSLNELVNEGLHNKLLRMPDEARDKLRGTVERIINEGCNGLICIIL